MISIEVTETFKKGLRSLPPDRQKSVAEAFKKFIADISTPSLRIRRLRGTEDCWIINARRGDRVVLRQVAPDLFLAEDCGPHDNVYRRWDR